MVGAKQTSNKQLTFNLENAPLMTEVNSYLHACPVTVEDNEILQAKIQKTPSSLNGRSESDEDWTSARTWL